MSNFIIVYSLGTVRKIDELTEHLINESNNLNCKIIDIRGNQPQQMIGGGWRGVNRYRGADDE